MIENLFLLSDKFIALTELKYKRYFLNETSHFAGRLSILIGQRGVGKTTILLQHLLQSYTKERSRLFLYLPCDHYKVKNYSLYDIAEAFSLNGGQYLYFDEIHQYNNWSEELKSIYDTFPDLKIICSGSSLLEIKKASHDLSRRAVVYNLPGLSFREFIELSFSVKFESFSLSELVLNHEEISGTVIDTLSKVKQKIIPLFKKYLVTGYFPYFLEHKHSLNYFTTLQQNIDRTLEGDLASAYPKLSGATIGKLKKLLMYLSGHCPFTPNLSRLSDALGVGDERTIKDYLYYLDRANLVVLMHSQGALNSQLTKPEKIFLQNTNLMHALLPEGQIDIGNIRETFFQSMLVHQGAVGVPKQGDFSVDDYIFEVGGKTKTFSQIRNLENSYLAIDSVEKGIGNKIPLWMFGFLY